MTACTHLDTITISELPESIQGCEECLSAGGSWCHLRICMACGHVGCCDSSPGRHATAHSKESGHPIMRSVQPGEDWAWCYVDEVTMQMPFDREPTLPRSPLCP